MLSIWTAASLFFDKNKKAFVISVFVKFSFVSSVYILFPKKSFLLYLIVNFCIVCLLFFGIWIDFYIPMPCYVHFVLIFLLFLFRVFFVEIIIHLCVPIFNIKNTRKCIIILLQNTQRYTYYLLDY